MSQQTVTIWKAGECDWVLASSEIEAREVVASYSDSLEDDDEVRALTDGELDALNYLEDPYDPDARKMSFRAKLSELAAKGEDKPGPFAVSDY